MPTTRSQYQQEQEEAKQEQIQEENLPPVPPSPPGPQPAAMSDPEPEKNSIKLFALTDSNYNDWDLRVANELYTLEAEDIYTQSQPNPDGTEKTDIAPNIGDKLRRKVWGGVTRSLPHSLMKVNDDVKRGDVEELLRRVRQSYYLPGTTTISALLEQLQAIQLLNYRTAKEYMAAIRHIVERLAQQNEKMSDSLILFYTLKGLPDDYATVKRELECLDPKPNLIKITKEITSYAAKPNITGSTIRGQTHDRVNMGIDKNKTSTKATVEVCRSFAKTGRCTWTRGQCKFAHVVPPGGFPHPHEDNSTEGKAPEPKRCTYCNVRGHVEKDCKKKKDGITTRCTNCNIIGHEAKDCRRNKAKQSDQGRVAVERSIADDFDKGYDIVSMALDSTDDAHGARDNQPANTLKFLLDSGATCHIITAPEFCIDVKPADVTIAVGGGVYKCTQTGDIPLTTETGLKILLKNARICPTFGSNVISETLILRHGAKMMKDSTASYIAFDKHKIPTHRSRAGLDYVILAPMHKPVDESSPEFDNVMKAASTSFMLKRT